MRTLCIIALLFFSCGPAPRPSTDGKNIENRSAYFELHPDIVAGHRREVRAILDEIDKYDPLAGYLDRQKKSLDIEHMLSRIHPSLVEGKALKRLQINNYSLLVLREMPDHFFDEMRQITLESNVKSGIGLLNSEFWAKAQTYLAAGLKVAFFDSDKDSQSAGVFFPEYNLMAFDGLSNAGTLAHEYRHYEQSTILQGRKATKRISLSESCLSNADRFFAELDATTIQLPYFIDVILRYQAVGDWGCDEDAAVPDRYHFPQIFDIAANLHYPFDVSELVIKDKTCPTELNMTIDRLATSTFEFYKEFDQLASNKLRGLRRQHRINTTLLNSSECRGWENKASSTSRDYCAEVFAKNAALPHEAEALKIKINRQIVAESLERPRYTREIINKLDTSLRSDLCLGSGAFRLLDGCVEFPLK